MYVCMYIYIYVYIHIYKKHENREIGIDKVVVVYFGGCHSTGRYHDLYIYIGRERERGGHIPCKKFQALNVGQVWQQNGLVPEHFRQHVGPQCGQLFFWGGKKNNSATLIRKRMIHRIFS